MFIDEDVIALVTALIHAMFVFMADLLLWMIEFYHQKHLIFTFMANHVFGFLDEACTS